MVTIRLFGHARYEVDGVIAPFKAPPRAIAMLAYLIVHQAMPVTRNYLAELLWPDDEIEIARGKLRRHVHVVVQSLPHAAKSPPYVLTTMQTVRWNPAADAVVDVLAFSAALRAGRCDEATRWYSGNFLESFFDDWVIAERERLRAAQLDALGALIQRLRGENDVTGALSCVDRMLELDPWREDAVRLQMALRVKLGDRGGAAAVFRAFVERLNAELDVDPTPETRAVYDALLRGEPLREIGNAAEAVANRAPPAMPFTGRGAEFARLTRAWSGAAYGRGGMVLVSGEAGAGKSRLAHELALHVEREGGGVLSGVTRPGETGPYEAVIDALRGAVPLLAAALSPEQLGVLARVLPEIATRWPIAEPPARGPEAERERIFAGIYDAIASLARRRPLLIVLEDLQWTSVSSAALLEYLVRRVTTLPVLIVGTLRDEDAGRVHPLRGLRRRLEGEGALEHIGIGRLTRDDVSAIVRQLVPDTDEAAAGLADRLYTFSEGVPFFLDAAIHAGEQHPPNDRPDTIARVERLSQEARDLLGIAAVAGSGFSVDVLTEVAGWSESEVLRALDALVEARFVRQGQRRRLGDYAFAHHLIHAAVYERLPERTRRRRHALTARAMAALYDERSEASAEIARHYDASGDSAAAARAHHFAAVHARTLFANDEALWHVERALPLVTDEDQLVELHVMRAWLGHALGRSDSRAQSIRALAMLPIPPAQLPEVERLRATNAMLEGRFDDARWAATRSLAAACAIGDRRLTSLAHLECATIAIVTDRYEDAQTALDAAAALVESDELHLREMRARTLLVQRRGAHGAELRVAAQHLLDEALRLGDPQAEAEAHVRSAHVEIAALNFAAAQLRFERAAEAYRRFGNPRGVDSVQNNAANLALWMGDYAGAERLYAACFGFAQENSDEANMFGCTIGMTLAAIYTGRFEVAKQRMHGVSHLERRHETMEDANAHLCSGLIETECANESKAGLAFDRSLAIHRPRPPNALYALTLAFAILQAVRAGDLNRAVTLDAELGALPAALLCAEEFPHLMYWARAAVALARNDTETARRFRSQAEALYRERIASMTDTAAVYATVPWNARFLAGSDASRTL